MKRISIIVPVYNQEKYLDECILSIIHQTYSNLEIILVDDGSFDHSLEICHKYREMDSRIQVIHKENGGLSSARNAGLDVASGEYIMFCDSDDYYLPDTCLLMEREITFRNADYVIGNYINCTEEGEFWEKPIFDLDYFHNFRLSIKDYDQSFYIMSSSVCNKIFRTSFIRGLNLRFMEGVPAEDAIFTTYCFIKSQATYYIQDIIYAYRQRNSGTSISTSNNLPYFQGISKAYHMIYMNFKNNGELGFYQYFYLKTLFYIMYKFIDSTLMARCDEIASLKELLWFLRLYPTLNIRLHEDDFGNMISAICLEEYDKALDFRRNIFLVRQNMSEEDKLKMSKIPPHEYKNYIMSEVL